MCVNGGLYVHFNVETQTWCISALLFLQEAVGHGLKADGTEDMHSVVKERSYV